MPPTLLKLLLPGETLSGDIGGVSLGWAGLDPGWCLLAWLVLLAGLVWSYLRYAPLLPRRRRLALTALRTALVGLLLLLLARPVLQLEVEERTRRTLAVLVDTSQSMTLADGRAESDDLQRAAIATGLLAPDGGLKQSLSPGQAAALNRLPRSDLLAALAANSRLGLWPALHAKADLEFFGFGRGLSALGPLTPGDRPPTAAGAGAFFKGLRYEDNLTSLGDALREVLDRKRGQSLGGVLVITDGASNSGAVPLEAARLAKQDGVPLYVYGVGVTTPRDLAVVEVNAPPLAFLKDRAVFTVRLRATGLAGQKAKLTLAADGRTVETRTVDIPADGEQEITLGFVPEKLGDVAITVAAAALPGETVTENNTAAATTRVVDTKTRILYVEGEPRWEFRFLLGLLQRDRRLSVKCALLDGDPDLAKAPDSAFLAALPDDRNLLFEYDVIIIGDADPKKIGPTRMALIAEWVEKAGGGLAFLAGPRFTPAAYRGTPLEKLMPVELDSGPAESPRYDEPVALKLTAAGERSMLLKLSDNPRDNAELWAKFPGVRWTARVGRARPAAQTLLTDPTPARANRTGPMPVLVAQPYGLGQIVYVGTDSTYVWRSGNGEKFHTRVWGQILQALSAARQRGGSPFIRLNAERARYLAGERVVVHGRAFAPDFSPLTDPDLPGTLSIQTGAKPGEPAPPPRISELRLAAVTGRPGEFRGEFVARTAGGYAFTAARDPAALAKFEVVEPRLEFADTALNESLLRAMAEASGGGFLREEDLAGLPAMVATGTAGLPVFKRLELAFSPWLLGLLVLVPAAEWFLRRRAELK